MAAQVLYRKWRPQTFDEVVGQQHVIQTLRNALAANEVAHAYLFAGPRGTGKTTVARLLAKAVNCLNQDDERPCNRCDICQALNEGRLLDLIEVDAASNRGIDEIRDLRTKVGFSPSQARYKVYILDEAHMLTDPAFNALLKTLEEPPGHVIFILVTTEPHRMPATIISRCQRFDFHRLSLPEIIGELERIAKLEGVTSSDPSEEASQREALELIARSATGSLRDAISLLDQVMTAGKGKITLEQVQEVLGTARMGAVAELASCLIEQDVGAGLRLIHQVVDQGADVHQFIAQVMEYLHALLLLQVGGLKPSMPAELVERMQEQAGLLSAQRTLRWLRLFNRAGQEAGRGTQPQLSLEMALVEAILEAREEPAAERAPHRPDVVSKAVAETEAKTNMEAPTSTLTSPPPGDALARLRAAWPRILRQVRDQNVATEAFLKACEPVSMEQGQIVLGFRYSFHRDKVEEQDNRRLIEEVIGSVLGEPCAIRCILESELEAELSEASSESGPHQEPSASPSSGDEATQVDGWQGGDDKWSAVADDPVVQAMVDRYGAQVADVQQW